MKFNREIRKWKEGLKGQDKKTFDTIIKTANLFRSISNALDTIHTDRLANKNVKNYTLVIFGGKMIVAKNCIHKLILTIFGGRTSQVGADINWYLTSHEYQTNRYLPAWNIASREGASMEDRQQQKIKMESDWNVISRFPASFCVENRRDLQTVIYKLIRSKEEAIALVYADGRKLDALSAELQKDKDVLLTAIPENEYAIRSASPELKKDKDFMSDAVSRCRTGRALHYAEGNLKKDMELALAAVQHHGYALQFAEEFQGDKEVVLAAILNDPNAVGYASRRLQIDPEVRRAAGR